MKSANTYYRFVGTTVRIIALCLAVFRLSVLTVAQNNEIVYPENENDPRCTECLTFFDEIPMEVQYGIVNQNDTLYFAINDKKYFDLLFKDSEDGIAIDVVPKSTYNCDQETSPFTGVKGRLTKAVYQPELLKKATMDAEKIVFVPIAMFPKDLNPEEAEYNILFMKKNLVCHYERFWDIPVHRWDLLEMGLYRDATFKSDVKTTEVSINKIMKFTIPFERNKFVYAKKDIQPIYDSLDLTDYKIRGLYIEAYSSVEGPTDNNILLQQNRAKSIIQVFEELEQDIIPTKVIAAENWVEFLEDISKLEPYHYLLKMSKAEIKKELSDEMVLEDLDPILAGHRKANVILKLVKKSNFSSKGIPQLVAMYNQEVKEEHRQAAAEIQQVLFEKIGNIRSPDSILEQLVVPNSLAFIDVKLDRMAYRFKQTDDVDGTLHEMLKIKNIMPNNKRVQYNIMALKIRSWAYGGNYGDRIILWKGIDSLSALGIHESLLARLRINFKIVECEYLMSERDYAGKNVALQFIYDNYKALNNSDADLLNLAKFFTGYGRHDWAIGILENKAKEVKAEEDLLFYYLNLTIVDPTIVAQPFYKSIVLNATNKNKERYCKLFNTYGYGGITFQLLDDPNLKVFHCQECR